MSRPLPLSADSIEVDSCVQFRVTQRSGEMTDFGPESECLLLVSSLGTADGLFPTHKRSLKFIECQRMAFMTVRLSIGLLELGVGRLPIILTSVCCAAVG